MKAVRIHAKQDMRLEDIEEPAIEAGKVLLRGGYTGICGTDLHLYYSPDMFALWDFTQPAKLTGAKWPQIMGHEFSGVVSAVGAGVDSVKVGDRVAVFPYHSCGKCAACQAGDTSWCPEVAFEGIQGHSGGMAEISIIDAANCLVLPTSLDLRHGALVEPMAVAWKGVTIANPDPAKAAVVLGAGPIGLGAYFALRARGVETIIVSEPSEARRDILKKLGVQQIVDPLSDTLSERVMALTRGAGADVVIDCAGAPTAFVDALHALGLYGRMVIVAAYSQPVNFEPRLLAGGKTVQISATYNKQDFVDVIQAMEQHVYCIEGWVDIVRFDQVEKTIHDLQSGKGMKVLVETPIYDSR